MVWVDTHCHLYAADDEPATLLERAAAAGVDWVVCPGVDAATSEDSLRIAGEHPGRVVATAGLHPHEAERWPDERSAIADMVGEAAAVGECGLDFYRNLAPRSAQLEAFTGQVALAADAGKPLIVHCRDAFADVHDVLAASGIADRTVLHCWTGGPKWTRRFRELGVTFSFAGPITYPTGDTVRLGAAQVPLDAVLVETDTPYLTPPPLRHEPNEPANVVTVGESLAGVLGVSPDELADRTSQRAATLFR